MTIPVPDRPSDAISYLSERMLELFTEKDPFRAEEFGIQAAAAILPRHDEESCDERLRAYRSITEQAQALDAAALAPQEQLTREIIIEQAEASADLLAAEPHTFTVNRTREFSTAALARGLTKAHITSIGAARAYLARLRALPQFTATDLAALACGAAEDRPALRSSLQASVDELQRHLATPLNRDPLLSVPVEPFPGANTWRQEVQRVVHDLVRPALGDYINRAQADLIPRARGDEHLGLCWLRGGDHIYRAFLREETTLDLDPQHLHHEGLELHQAAVEQIRALGLRLLDTDDYEEILKRLRTDPQFAYPSAVGALASARATLAEVEARLPQWFGLTDPPRCAVEPMPAATAVGYPSAQYMPATIDRSRGGRIYLNLTQPRFRDEVAGLVRGSGVPGTHMYWSYALRADIPVFRRIAYIHGFVKGWSAYGIELATEMDPDIDDISQLGLWSKRAANACRLIVDTGVHALGWSRQKALTFQIGAYPCTAHDANVDLDRIVAMPGEGPIWALGSREFLRTRDHAATTLGTSFTVRAFHDRLLENGAMPLHSMRQIIDRWADQPTRAASTTRPARRLATSKPKE